MKSIDNVSEIPSGTMLVSDDIVDFHASRILLLHLICGIRDQATGYRRIDGLTKLAKLDFFVRYPKFFERAARSEGKSVRNGDYTVSEPEMVRHHYGPWDKRYYQVLPYLEARGLLNIRKDDKYNQFRFYLTEAGIEVGNKISKLNSFSDTVKHINTVNDVFRNYSGTKLKYLIYDLFDKEVADKEIGDVIPK